MKHLAGTVIGLFACVVATATIAGDESWRPAPRAIVELFTSQGCSSCVKADEYFAEIARRDDVVALSFHVDYWDYLGWRDTFGDAANSERQRSYASARHGSPRVYTPQIVVNGRADFVGSDRTSIDEAIAQSALHVPVTMRHGDGTVEIEVAGRPIRTMWPATIRLALLTTEAEVAISRGENAGSTIEYYNVVRAMRPIGMWDGNAVKITLPEHELMVDGVDACAILVQEDTPKGHGAIIGAAWLGNW
jgi:hypothetical protein